MADIDNGSLSADVSACEADDSATTSHTGTAGGLESSSGQNYREVRNMTSKENKDVETWRDLVTGVLVITACFVSTASFIYLSRDETVTFQIAFNQQVVRIGDSAKKLRNNINDGFTAVTDSITAHAQTTSSRFPFVTVPFFEIHGDHARDIARVDVFSFCPLVMQDNRSEWEGYSVNNTWWLPGDQVVAYTEQEQDEIVDALEEQGDKHSIPEKIYRIKDGIPTTDMGAEPYAPRWQTSPPPSDLLVINYDVLSQMSWKSLFYSMVATNGPVMSEIVREDPLLAKSMTTKSSTSSPSPRSVLFYPVYKDFQYNATGIVGFLEIPFNWLTFLYLLLPEGEGGLYYILNNTCGDTHTFQVTSEKIVYVGEGDHHNRLYERQVATIPLITDGSQHIRACSYDIIVYPSYELRHEYSTDIPAVFTAVIAAAFFLMAFFFFAYDKFVQRRNDMVVRHAAKTNAIVASLFPSTVRDRLFGENASLHTSKSRGSFSRTRLKNFLTESSADKEDNKFKDEAIADLFPFCTVLFADIVGFTAWSSMREPTQVFLLLENIYQAFDLIAKRRKVFKVETIGDCYVAVTGLPEPNKQHALVMAKFARDCMYKMHEVTRTLEVSLGPDTGDLSMRFGIHSGPVTAGVLRGERSRFQLFGDTVNTAARMESTGRPGSIHVSQEAADAITETGKAHWLRERTDKVTAKGKGELTTFWLSLADHSSAGDGQSFGDSSARGTLDPSSAVPIDKQTVDEPKVAYTSTKKSPRDLSDKTGRLVDWNVDILQRLLKQIAAKQKIMGGKANQFTRSGSIDNTPLQEKAKPQMVLEEVQEVIKLPKFISKVAGVVGKSESIALPSEVVIQLHDYVATIASMYHDNPFHNFEHASHVTMSVVKLLSRIVAPADLDYDQGNITNERKFMKSMASKMHDHTYGITSDPLTQFAVVFSALIHDVDHGGIPNAQLVKEKTEIAKKYKGKSVAEQNSVDIAWDLLMADDYEALRNAICANQADWTRFRQLVVNSVMATDIVDKELKDLRNERWDKAFKGDFIEVDLDTDRNRKATIVIEHLIQASDISHTMQHWHIYRKWNERLFCELYRAYMEGRAEKNPSDFWFKGEIGFFNFYIIPLAKKLKDCGVFGVSSDEYLNYAEKNLAEWTMKGEQVVAEMVEKAKKEYGEVGGQSSY